MSRESTLLAGRVAAEAGMTDTCVIRRKSGRTTNPDSGAVEDTFTTVWSGPCRLQERGLSSRDADAGDRTQVVVRPELQLPIAARGVLVDDIAEITDALDPENVGRKVRVDSLPIASQKTSRRFMVEENQT